MASLVHPHTTMNISFSEAIFQQDFPLTGPHLIAASAGTGKTYNIQNIYARLIMEYGFLVDKIQVMTYTEAATKELRDRLHSVLADVQARLQTPQADCQGKDTADITRRNERADRLLACLSPAQRPYALPRIELALLDFDQAAISTIHGFCKRILDRNALEIGLKFNQEVQDSKSDDLNSLVADWWRKRPQNVPEGVTLGDLQHFVSVLGQKAIYEVEPPDETTVRGYLLARACEIVTEYEKGRTDRKSLNFDDLIRAVYDALNGSSGDRLATAIRNEFQAALIDEFQDTDPVQYAIFERVFLANPDFPLYFVGDPKQAIYAFRGGDIYTYLKAAKAISPDRTYALDINFRSTKSLMKAVNDLFMDPPASEDGQRTRTFGDPQITYEFDVKVKEEPVIKGCLLEQPFSVVFLPDNPIDNVKAALVERLKQTLQECDEDGRPVFTPRDLVILLRSHGWEHDLQKLLRAQGIPSVIAKSGNVFSSSIATELRLFLLAIAHPQDKRNVLGALATVFAGQNLQELPALSSNPDWLAQKIAGFTELKKVWLTRGFASLAPYLENEDCVLRLAAHQDGARLLANLKQILELACAAVKQNGTAPETLLDWLTERINHANDEDETPEYTSRLETEDDAVKIMTIHASKGLQFPMVFLPDCWKISHAKPKEDKIEIFSYHNAEKGNILTFSTSQEANTKNHQEALLENIRLLYVAMTRAVQRTVVLTPPESTIGADEPLKHLLQNARDNFARRQQDDQSIVSPIAWLEQNTPPDTADKRVFTPAEDPETFTCKPLARTFDLRPSKGSYTALSTAVQTNGDDDERDLDISDRGQPDSTFIPQHDIFKIPSGETIGTCWHNILEKLPFQTTEQEIAALSAEELLCCGFQPDQCLPETALTIQDLTVSMVQKTLEYPLTSPDGVQFSLRDIGWNQRLSEQEFNFASATACDTTRELARIISRHWQSDPEKAPFLEAIANWYKLIPHGFLNGFIDLIFQHGEFFYIIDWKSNSLKGKLENFCQEGLTREIASHGYFFQYLLYATVLHAYLKQTLGHDYSWERNFGGVRYFFLRGIAANCSAPVFADRPPAALLDDLGRALGINA
jgi:exodeoxyribonuclease V beta subunit